MKSRSIGIALAIISAFAFGVAPLFTKITFSEGSNGIMTMLLRNLLSIPFLLIFILVFKISLKINKKQFFQLILLNAVGATMTGCLIYSSYNYVGTGLATCLHFIYPVLIMVCCSIIFKERPTFMKIAALAISLLGIILSVDITNFSFLGFSMAVLSGVTYAFYVMYIDKTGLKHHNIAVITLYSCIINVFCTAVFANLNGSFTLNITPLGWGAALGVAILSSIVGIAFLQGSLQFIDSPTASIMSTVEPLTSVFFGIVILHEPLTTFKLISCALIILSVLLIALDNRRGYAGYPDEEL